MGLDPMVASIADRTWCVNEYGCDALYLLEGDERALLIDTGTGTFDIRSFVQKFTSKPLIAACTHGHVDHAGGMGVFEEIWMSGKDYAAAAGLTIEDRENYVDHVMQFCTGLYKIGRENVWKWECIPKLHPLKEGDIIDLGNRVVEVYETSGHTAGGLSFLDTKERILFTGDACNSNTLLLEDLTDPENAGMEALLRTAEKLNKLAPRYDRNFNGHVGYGPLVDFCPLSDTIAEDAMICCRGILEGRKKGSSREDSFCGRSLFAQQGAFGVCYHESE